MGVRWLTAYVADVERSVSSDVTFPCSSQSSAQGVGSSSSNGDSGDSNNASGSAARASAPPVFVVDAWAFIFRVWLTCFGDSVRGLDLAAYQEMVRAILAAWTAAGIHTIFVFDGPMLPIKLPKLVERRAKTAASNQAYMKSSPESRASRRFQRECGVQSPLLSFATVDALRQAAPAVKIVFAPTEADSLVAEIAASQPQGYAVSQDSDYFVLCARGQGCAGYVPLESIEYLVNVPSSGQTSAPAEEPSLAAPTPSPHDQDAALAAALARGEIADTATLNDGFEEVGNRKRGRRRPAKGLSTSQQAPRARATPQHLQAFPPLPSQDNTTSGKVAGVRIRAYRAHDLASQLQLSPSLMPLLAAIIGNDYSTSLQSQVLLRHVQGAQRVKAAASILREEWVRVKGGAGGRLGLRDTAKAAGSPRRGAGRMQLLAGHQPQHHLDDDAQSDMGSSATATPTRTPGTMRPASVSTPSDPVRSMVEAIVDKALADAESYAPTARYVASGERASVIDSVIDSAATYSLLTHSSAPHLASPSALFFGDAIPALAAQRAGNFGGREIAQPQIVARYRQAYEEGNFHTSLVEIMTKRVFFTALMPEQTESPTVHVTAARSLRAWMYAVLFEAWGTGWARDEWDLPERTDDESDDASAVAQPFSFAPDRTYKEGESADDVISVHTESSESEEDSRSEAEAPSDNHDDLPTRPGSVNEVRQDLQHNAAKPPLGVAEYVRAGSMYTEQLVRIPSLSELLRHGTGITGYEANEAAAHGSQGSHALPPALADLLGQHEAAGMQVQGEASQSAGDGDGQAPMSDPQPPPVALLPLGTRLDLFLHAHQACTPAIKALPPRCWAVASVLRTIVAHEARRLRPSGRTRDNWSRSELDVAIRSATQSGKKSVDTDTAADAAAAAAASILPSARAVHLGSTMQLVLQTSSLFAQALLLLPPSTRRTEDRQDAFTSVGADVNGSREKATRGGGGGSAVGDDDAGWRTALAHPHESFHGPTFYAGMARIHDAVELDDEDGSGSRKAKADATDAGYSAQDNAEPGLASAVLAAIVQGYEDALGIDALDLKRERKAKKRAARAAKAGAGGVGEAAAAADDAAEPSSQQPQQPTHGIQRRGTAARATAGRNAFALLGME